MNRTLSFSRCMLYNPFWSLVSLVHSELFVDFRRVHNENQDFYKVCEAGQGSFQSFIARMIHMVGEVWIRADF